MFCFRRKRKLRIGKFSIGFRHLSIRRNRISRNRKFRERTGRQRFLRRQLFEHWFYGLCRFRSRIFGNIIRRNRIFERCIFFCVC